MLRNRLVLVLAAPLILLACAQTGATPSPQRTATATAAATGTPAATATPTASAAANIPAVVCVGESTTYLDYLNGEFQPDTVDPIPSPSPSADELLDTIRDRGKLVVSTDKDYAPQSFQEPDGSWVGFDVDVATKIAEGLGVDVEFMHVDWEVITAGSWNQRWDISVGSMTITTPRKGTFSFTQPYYYTPAFMAASTRSGITALDQLPFEVPGEVTAQTLPTDANCIEQIAAGRPEFDLLITSETVIDEAVQANQPIVKIGEPIYVEDLAVAIDKSGPPHAALLYEVDKMIGEWHADGTLTALSEEWFEGADLTQPPGE